MLLLTLLLLGSTKETAPDEKQTEREGEKERGRDRNKHWGIERSKVVIKLAGIVKGQATRVSRPLLELCLNRPTRRLQSVVVYPYLLPCLPLSAAEGELVPVTILLPIAFNGLLILALTLTTFGPFAWQINTSNARRERGPLDSYSRSC